LKNLAESRQKSRLWEFFWIKSVGIRPDINILPSGQIFFNNPLPVSFTNFLNDIFEQKAVVFLVEDGLLKYSTKLNYG